jgi:hypothetical protein
MCYLKRQIFTSMSERKKSKPKSNPVSPSADGLSENLPDDTDLFDSALTGRMREIASSGLNPSSALDLIISLIAEVPAASKVAMDRIKMLDKLLNTARAMMETKLKNEDAAQLSARLDQLEMRMKQLFMQKSEADSEPLELWHAGQRER